MLGDNLGINTALGFVKSFNANTMCRFCKANKFFIKNMCIEIEKLNRTKSNYISDLNEQNTFNTGIVENSVFNQIENFHVIDNMICDPMHDLLEGVFQYNFTQILSYFINSKVLDLDAINSRIKNFNFGETEKDYKPTKIKKDHLKNNHFSMSAREMWCFVHHFSMLFGDMVTDKEDEVWKFAMKNIELLDFIFQDYFNEVKVNHLIDLVQQINTMYTNIFKTDLKPKHHFLIHYGRIVRSSGPVRYLNCLRYESKHQVIKSYCNNMTCRKNICQSIATKQLLSNAYRFFTQDPSFKLTLFVKPKWAIDTDNIENLYLNFLKLNGLSNPIFYKKLKLHETTYKPDYYLVLEKDSPNVYKIIHIFIHNEKAFFICHKHNDVFFDHRILMCL